MVMESAGYFLTWEEWIDSNPLRVLMENASMPQMQLASRVGVSANAVQRWLKGTSAPVRGNIEAMAKVFSVDADELEKCWLSWADARP